MSSKRDLIVIGSKKLESLIETMEVLAPGSKQYFCSQLAGSSLNPSDLRLLVEAFDTQELSYLLQLVAERLKNSKSTEATHVMAKM